MSFAFWPLFSFIIIISMYYRLVQAAWFASSAQLYKVLGVVDEEIEAQSG